MNKVAISIVEKFNQLFPKSSPSIYFSPGRINFIGEHIDYNDGYVMPAAINLGIYFAISKNNSQSINFYAQNFDDSFSIKINEIKKQTGWKNYVLSVINQFLLLHFPLQGFNCVFGGDIPVGSGISSSAAVEGGLAFAINDVFKLNLNRVDLALLCQRAEHDFPNVKCGIMDMYANLLGKSKHVFLLDCKTNTHQYLPIHLKNYSIVLINTKVQHSLNNGEYNLRRKRCEEGLEFLKRKLKINSFRDIENTQTILPFKSNMNALVYDCCKYVIEEILRTKEASVLLQQNNIAAFGKLMYQTHDGLSHLFKVSCIELDFLVNAAKNFTGVLGARLMGGGFGGCTINIVDDKIVDDFIKKSTISYQNKFKIKPDVYLVSIVDGTSLIG